MIVTVIIFVQDVHVCGVGMPYRRHSGRWVCRHLDESELHGVVLLQRRLSQLLADEKARELSLLLGRLSLCRLFLMLVSGHALQARQDALQLHLEGEGAWGEGGFCEGGRGLGGMCVGACAGAEPSLLAITLL